jgi:hypothetical protein
MMHSDQHRRTKAAAVPAIALVLIANFIPLYSALAQDWPVVYVVMLFWFDALMFIAFTAIRILIAPVPGDLSLTLARKTAIAAVTLKVFYKTVVATVTLAVHGGLVLGYGIFLAFLFGGEITPRGIVASPDVPLEVMTSMLHEPVVYWAALAILGNHLYSLTVGFIMRGEWRTAQQVLLFEAPTRHVLVLHVGIVLGGIVLVLLATPLIAAAVLLAAKTVSDLRLLIRERSAA